MRQLLWNLNANAVTDIHTGADTPKHRFPLEQYDRNREVPAPHAMRLCWCRACAHSRTDTETPLPSALRAEPPTSQGTYSNVHSCPQAGIGWFGLVTLQTIKQSTQKAACLLKLDI